jgi:hypothetical protein
MEIKSSLPRRNSARASHQTEDCQEARLAPPDRNRSDARHLYGVVGRSKTNNNPKSGAEALRSSVDHAK